MTISHDEPLNAWTFWKIGGPAEHFCLPKAIEDLKEACGWAEREKQPITILGGGTNVLVSDKGIRGLVICLQAFTGSRAELRDGRWVVEALAGTPKAEVMKSFLKSKLAPALFLCGLPGDVGGGVVMNAGVAEAIAPREFVEIVDWFEVLRGNQIIRYDKNDVTWTYRHTSGWEPGIVVNASMSWPFDPDETIGTKVKEATKNRIAKQPLNFPSCGSTFKNPPGQKAGALIDQSGLKGYQVGGAQVSPKHANFIVNLGGATATDVHAIIQHVQKTVHEKFHVKLETEVRYLGNW